MLIFARNFLKKKDPYFKSNSAQQKKFYNLLKEKHSTQNPEKIGFQ